MANRVEGDLIVTGGFAAQSMTVPAGAISNAMLAADAAVARSKLAQDALKSYPVNLTDLRVWDAMATVLPGTSASDDLGLYGGTWGTHSAAVKTSDLKAAGSTTRYARFMVPLPAEYDPGETVTLRFSAGMETTIADVAATIDAEVYESNKFGGISADLCTTAAQSINSTTAANKDFTITPTNLVAGDILDVRIALLVNDAATATAVIGKIGSIELLCDVRG